MTRRIAGTVCEDVFEDGCREGRGMGYVEMKNPARWPGYLIKYLDKTAIRTVITRAVIIFQV